MGQFIHSNETFTDIYKYIGAITHSAKHVHTVYNFMFKQQRHHFKKDSYNKFQFHCKFHSNPGTTFIHSTHPHTRFIYVLSSASAFSTEKVCFSRRTPESTILTSFSGLSRALVLVPSILRTTFIPLRTLPKTT